MQIALIFLGKPVASHLPIGISRAQPGPGHRAQGALQPVQEERHGNDCGHHRDRE